MRSRITAAATVVVLVVLAATGFALVAAQRVVLTDNVDEVLERQVAEITRLIDSGTLAEVIPGQGDDDAFAWVSDSSGRVIASTARRIDLAELPGQAGGDARFVTVRTVQSGGEYRVLVQPHGDVLIVAGTPLDDVNESVATLIRALAIAVPAASLLLAVLVWLLVGGVLRPVERIRSEVSEISGGNLDRRVPEPGTRDEIDSLARTMNQMLARIQAASDRQRRFVADASHELRSPLTRIRTELEVDLAHPEAADLAATHRSVLADTETLRRLVDDLLTLARLDEGGVPLRREPVDLDDVVLREVQAVGAPVDVSSVSAARVLGDSAQLARVVRNLLENAVRHGGSTASVELHEDGNDALLAVSDDGPGIPPELHGRVFERFARLDEARTPSEGGTGLGLAIAREIVEAHGGTVTIDATHQPGARFVVRLPLATS